MDNQDKKPVQFYFSLPRMVMLLFGGNAQRSENNWFEAALVGTWMYLINYLYFVTKLVPLLPTRLLIPLVLVSAAFMVWLFWLILIYVNSLVIRVLGLFGLFRNVPRRRAQNILWGIITTVMAGEVLMSHPWLWQLSMVWLIVVALNLVASLALSYSDAARGFDD